MGLKKDIQTAFENSIGPDADGNKGSPEIEQLSIDLSKAITKYISRQTFHIAEFNAPVLTVGAMGPSQGMASMSKTGKGMTGNPLENLNTNLSKVVAGMIKIDEIT
tara:strand:- start:401 stop:718 length:318 start_codon:yes stop_codon:yes gene_type:complete